MSIVKDIVVRPIKPAAANEFVKKNHYSGKIVPNSQLHLGAFLNNNLHGVMQFGPSMDKNKTIGLVRDTGWNEFIELNRMAFDHKLPKNSESRCISVAIRIFKKRFPHIKWVVSFADATQCGDGAIYRASGFKLTQIKRNTTIIEFPDGERVASIPLSDVRRPARLRLAKKWGANIGTSASLKPFYDIGAKPVAGYMLRYIYFIDKQSEANLTCPILEYKAIYDIGAGMYKGKKVDMRQKHNSNAPSYHEGEGGAEPTLALHSAIQSKITPRQHRGE